MQLAHAAAFVKRQFEENPAHKQAFGFRDKYAHTLRVLAWAKRLLASEPADAEIVLTAAIFHDVGYTVSQAEHPRISAEICRRYLAEAAFDTNKREQVLACIENHPNKQLIYDESTPIETVLLIEADCLDESGALSVIRDALSEGAVAGGYEAVYVRLMDRKIVKCPEKLYCVTETAKKIWRDKQQLYYDFVRSLATDITIATNWEEPV